MRSRSHCPPAPVARRPRYAAVLLLALLCGLLACAPRAHAAPYGGTAVAVSPGAAPVKVEAENYDTGGEGVAYHDYDNGGQTGYRSDNIGVVAQAGTSNGYILGWQDGAEWEAYTINVTQAAAYTLVARVSGAVTGRSFHLEFGPVGQIGGAGVYRSVSFSVPNTGSYGTFQDVYVYGVSLNAGTQWMRLVLDGLNAGVAGIDYLSFASAANDNAAFVSQSVPATMTAGQSYPLTVTMQNTGATAWTEANGYRLGSLNPANNATWGVARALLPSTTTVSPSGSYPFLFTATAPSAPGTYNWQWGMVHDGVAFFGATTPNLSVTVVAAPAVPVGLIATGGTTQVSLTWNAASGATGYNLYRGTSPTGEAATPVKTNIPAGASPSTTDTLLASGTTYYYQVTAVNAAGTESGKSLEVNATTAPATPMGFSASPVSTSTINLSWTASPGATGYTLERSPDNVNGWTGLTLSPATATSYSDMSRSAGTRYYYRLKATNGGGPSAYATANEATPPEAPVLAASAGDGLVTLTWNAAAGAATYNLYRSTSPGGETLAHSALGGGPYTDTNVTNGVTYYYTLTAVSSSAVGSKESGPSAEVPATPQAPDFSLAASPASVSVPQVGSGTSTVTLTPLYGFTGSVDLTASGLPAGVTAQFSPTSVTASSPTSTLTLSASAVALAGTSAVTVTGASSSLPSRTATVSLAVTAGNNQSPTVSAGPDQSVTLPATANLSGTAGDDGLPNPPGHLTTTWSQVSGPGTVTFGDDAAKPATTASFSTDGAYVLRLTADDGAATATSDVTVTVSPAPAPAAPTNLVATAFSSSRIDLTWTPSSEAAASYNVERSVAFGRGPVEDRSIIVDGYNVERSVDGTNWTQVNASPVTVTSYSDTGLASVTTYSYRVRAVSSGVSSAPSSSVSTTTLVTANLQLRAGKTTTIPAHTTGIFYAPSDSWLVNYPSFGGPVVYESGGWYIRAPATDTLQVTVPIDAWPGTDIHGLVSGSEFITDALFDVVAPQGPKHAKKPGKDPTGQDPTQPILCDGGGGEGSVSGHIDQMTGNVFLEMAAGSATRGYPIRSNIILNSQVVETNRLMGNATFTDDVHVTTDTVYDQSGNSSSRLMLVDGDGTRLDFGPTSGAPTATAGVFSHLATVTGGYEVTGAGPPEAIHEAGNFSYLFNSNGQMTQITDPTGNVQTLTYTGGQLTQVTDQSTGKSLTYSYTGGLITQITQSGGTVTALTYSGSSLTGVTVKDGSGNTLRSAQFGYDANTGLLMSVQRDGNAATQVNFRYDYMPATDGSTTGVPMAVKVAGNDATDWGGTPDAGADDSVVQTFDGGAATAVHYNSDASGNLTQTVTPAFAGATQAYTSNAQYNANRQATSVSDGAVTELYGYETNGLLNSFTDGLNNTWSWNYSGADLTSAQDPVQAAASVSETLAYGDPSQPHVPTGYTDAEGNAWAFGHNSHGQTTSVTPPTGSPTGATTYTYDETPLSATLGYLLSETDGNGDTVTFDAYDSLGDVVEVSTYPETGNPAVKNTTQFAYDAAQRLRQVTWPDANTFQFHYTGSSLDYTVDEAGTEYDYTYCASCGLMTGVSGPLGWSLGWQRDADHKLKAFTDANSHQTLYSYGNAQELTGVAYPDGSGFSFLYNNQGRVRQVTNGRGHAITLGYDGAGRLHQASFPTTSQPTITASYDAAGRVNGFTDGVGATSYTYKLNGWLSKVVYDYSASGLTNAQEIDYHYNTDGTLSTLTWKNGTATVGVWSYGYDAGGRLTSLTNPYNETTTWAYDGEGKLLTQTNANGTSTTYGYNPQRGWPTSITHYGGATAFASYGLTYDGGANTVGNLTGVAETVGGNSSTVTYGYNALYRLTSEARTGAVSGGHTFGYDLAGNLTSLDSATATATYDDANKITNSGFSYDGDGDLTSDGTTAYAWDDRSDLVSRTAGGLTTSYGYDAQGLRVVSQVGLGIKTFYVFSGNTLLGEINGSDVVQAAYTWGAAGLVSERLVPSSKSLWYHFGPQGETRQVTDSTGSVADAYVYSAYGQLIASTGTDANPFRFGGVCGYYTDSAATNSVILCTHRWYDPNTARWLSRDPIGYNGGDNLYGYVTDNPVSGFDPDGLASEGSRKGSSPMPGDDTGIFWDWWYERGPVYRVYGPPDPGTQQLKDRYELWIIDHYRKAGYPMFYKGRVSTAGGFLSSIPLRSGTVNYVGGFSYHVSKVGGGNLEIQIYNNLSEYSWFLHNKNRPIYKKRSKNGRRGTIYQKFYWFQPDPSNPYVETNPGSNNNSPCWMTGEFPTP